jgi:hypothetical protein
MPGILRRSESWIMKYRLFDWKSGFFSGLKCLTFIKCLNLAGLVFPDMLSIKKIINIKIQPSLPALREIYLFLTTTEIFQVQSSSNLANLFVY